MRHSYHFLSDGTDYIFYDDVITFNGSYLVGDNECVLVYVNVPDDNLVEGNELFNVKISSGISPAPCVYIIDNDCKIFHVSMLGIIGSCICAFRFEGWFYSIDLHGERVCWNGSS